MQSRKQQGTIEMPKNLGPAPGSRVHDNHSRLSKNWLDESLIRQAVAEARARASRWPLSAGDAWRKQHGKPE
jgi:hypothetical protein